MCGPPGAWTEQNVETGRIHSLCSSWDIHRLLPSGTFAPGSWAFAIRPELCPQLPWFSLKLNYTLVLLALRFAGGRSRGFSASMIVRVSFCNTSPLICVFVCVQTLPESLCLSLILNLCFCLYLFPSMSIAKPLSLSMSQSIPIFESIPKWKLYLNIHLNL